MPRSPVLSRDIINMSVISVRRIAYHVHRIDIVHIRVNIADYAAFADLGAEYAVELVVHRRGIEDNHVLIRGRHIGKRRGNARRGVDKLDVLRNFIALGGKRGDIDGIIGCNQTARVVIDITAEESAVSRRSK